MIFYICSFSPFQKKHQLRPSSSPCHRLLSCGIHSPSSVLSSHRQTQNSKYDLEDSTPFRLPREESFDKSCQTNLVANDHVYNVLNGKGDTIPQYRFVDSGFGSRPSNTSLDNLSSAHESNLSIRSENSEKFVSDGNLSNMKSSAFSDSQSCSKSEASEQSPIKSKSESDESLTQNKRMSKSEEGIDSSTGVSSYSEFSTSKDSSTQTASESHSLSKSSYSSSFSKTTFSSSMALSDTSSTSDPESVDYQNSEGIASHKAKSPIKRIRPKSARFKTRYSVIRKTLLKVSCIVFIRLFITIIEANIGPN